MPTVRNLNDILIRLVSSAKDTEHFELDQIDDAQCFEQCMQYLSAAESKTTCTPWATATRKAVQTRIPDYFSWPHRLPNLPVDVVLEIASHMHPLDLIQLSLTSRSLRRILTSRQSRAAWLTVLRAIPELPQCPDDMSEIRYAMLVFGVYCFSCGAKDAFSVDYALRVRYCEDCYNARVCRGTDVLKDVPGAIRDLVMVLLPAEHTLELYNKRHTVYRLNPMSHVLQDAYLKHELVAMLRCCIALSSAKIDLAALEPLLKKRVDYVMQRQLHAAYLDAWENLFFCRMSDRVERRARLHALIRTNKHLEQPPSHEVGEVFESDEEPYEDDCEMDPADLTPEVVKRPFPKPPDNLYEEHSWHEDRDGISYEALLEARYEELEECYDELVEHHLGPEGYDIRTLPPSYNAAREWTMLSWKDGARSEIDFDTFLIYTGGMEQRFKAYREDMQRALASQVDWSACNGRWRTLDVIDQPAALFVCRECHRAPLPWPDINKHWCDEHSRKSIWISRDYGKVRIGWWVPGAEITSSILLAAGLDCDTKLARLNRLVATGRLLCSCGDPSLNASTPTWAHLVYHVYTHVQMNTDRVATRQFTEEGERLIWLDDHNNLKRCIKLRPDTSDGNPIESEDMRPASDSVLCTRVEAHLGSCPKSTLSPICRICKAMVSGAKDKWMILPWRADAIIYHMEAKHGRQFTEEDILFERPWYTEFSKS